MPTLNTMKIKTLSSLLICVAMLTGSVHAHDGSGLQEKIDSEVENYFNSIQSENSLDLDEQKLLEIFGESTVITPDENLSSVVTESSPAVEYEGSEKRTSFANLGRNEYLVKKGDTLYSISKKFNTTVSSIISLNKQVASRPLYVGDRLKIRKGSGASAPVKTEKLKEYKVQKGDTLSSIARNHNTTVYQLKKQNKLKDTVIKIGQVLKVKIKGLPDGYQYRKLFIMPAKGRLTSGYGSRPNPFVRSKSHFHKGIDIGAAMGTPFYSARDGIVVFSGRMGGYGNCIFVRHSGGYLTVYAHAKKNVVKKGDIVRQGQKLGEIGRTGMATGPHLHFEVRKLKKPINPFIALKMKEVVPVGSTAFRQGDE